MPDILDQIAPYLFMDKQTKHLFWNENIRPVSLRYQQASQLSPDTGNFVVKTIIGDIPEQILKSMVEVSTVQLRKQTAFLNWNNKRQL